MFEWLQSGKEKEPQNKVFIIQVSAVSLILVLVVMFL